MVKFMFALISTVDFEKPYRFCEVSSVKFAVTEPALFWVDCPEEVTPQTHKWNGSEFILIENPISIVNENNTLSA